MGEMILEKEVKRQNLKMKTLLKEGSLQKVAESFSMRNVDDLLSAIGYGKISARKVMTKLAPPEGQDQAKETPSFLQKIFEEATRKNKERHVVKVKGVEDLLVRFARCCNPVPGDSVVGFITRGRGISVHSRKCTKIFDSDPHRLVDIEWDLTKKTERHVKIRVVCEDRPGLLADMSERIRDQKANIAQAQIGTTKDKKAMCFFSISIRDVAHLKKIISKLEGINGVISVERVQRNS
jgi:GTP diphosphokinase / guanosine-3',5'-bis(diphosphate) 3'-diphosphatase